MREMCMDVVMVIQISFKLLRIAFNGRLVLVLFNLLMLLRQSQSCIQRCRRNLPHFGNTFLRWNYVGIFKNTHIWSWTVIELMHSLVCGGSWTLIKWPSITT